MEEADPDLSNRWYTTPHKILVQILAILKTLMGDVLVVSNRIAPE
jgi:hypothetical protein